MTELAGLSMDLGTELVQKMNGWVLGAGFELVDQWVAGARGEMGVNQMALGMDVPVVGQVAGAATTNYFGLMVLAAGVVLAVMYLLLFWKLLDINYKFK